MINKVFVINSIASEKGGVYERAVVQPVQEKYPIEHITTKELLFDTQYSDVRLISNNAVLDTDNSFFLFRSYGGVMSSTALLLCLLQHLKKPFTDPVNRYSNAFGDKSFFIIRAKMNGFKVPHSLVGARDALENNLSYIFSKMQLPFILKGSGKRGESIFLIKSEEDFIERLKNIETDTKDMYTVQEMVENTYDVRALFFKSSFVAAMRRVGVDGSHLNNISQGGTGSIDQLSPDEIKECQKLQEITEIDLAGIDFFRTTDGLVFIEVNRVPQLEGIASIYDNLELAEPILSYIQEFDD